RRWRGGPVTWLLVAAGAAVGAPLRYLAGRLLDGGLPRGTMLANWAGSFLMGLFSGLGLSGHVLALLGIGFCGALTTYSGFAFQVVHGGPRQGTATAVLTVVPALALCWLGFLLGA
ncbi:MAG: CrcB family protein, partial [Nocardioidaceae bacterium]